MNNILDQILLLAEYEATSIGAIERKIGASKGVLSRAINNRTDIQAKWIVSLVENYPQYNTDWLLTGKGEPLKNSKPEEKLTTGDTSLLIDMIREKDKKIDKLNREVGKLLQLVEGFRDLQLKKTEDAQDASAADAG